MTWIRVIDLHKSFHRGSATIEVLRGIDWEVSRPGMAIALVGPSGVGKTTFLHVLAGLESPDRGEIWIGEHPMHRMSPRERIAFRNRMMGIVYQHHFLIEELTAWENVILRGRLLGWSVREARDRAMQWLTRVGLAERMHHYPGELSGGEAQRVAIARALVHQPSILIADEPTGNLDEDTAQAVFHLMLALVRAQGTTLIMATHNRRLAEQCDVVYRLHRGRLELIDREQ